MSPYNSITITIIAITNIIFITINLIFIIITSSRLNQSLRPFRGFDLSFTIRIKRRICILFFSNHFQILMLLFLRFAFLPTQRNLLKSPITLSRPLTINHISRLQIILVHFYRICQILSFQNIRIRNYKTVIFLL